MNEVHTVCVRFHTAIELLGGRWTGAVLRALVTGAHRFAESRRPSRTSATQCCRNAFANSRLPGSSNAT